MIRLLGKPEILKTLNKLTCGERAFIVDMRNTLVCEKLFELGVFPGDLVEVKENTKDNNCIIVEISSKTFNIYRKAAETIVTNVVSLEMALN